jgi:hypothetical protein
MSDTSFLGLSKSEWELINSFANWASAAGSFAAAFVALHLANRISQPKAKTSVGHRILILPGELDKPVPEFVVFRIVNSGDRLIRVDGIGWKVGLLRKRAAMQMFETSMSSSLPVELTHGQEAKWFVPLLEREEHWIDRFAQEMLMPNYRISCATLHAEFYTSLGHVFATKPEANLLQKLMASCERLAKGK